MYTFFFLYAYFRYNHIAYHAIPNLDPLYMLCEDMNATFCLILLLLLKFFKWNELLSLSSSFVEGDYDWDSFLPESSRPNLVLRALFTISLWTLGLKILLQFAVFYLILSHKTAELIKTS